MNSFQQKYRDKDTTESFFTQNLTFITGNSIPLTAIIPTLPTNNKSYTVLQKLPISECTVTGHNVVVFKCINL